MLIAVLCLATILVAFFCGIAVVCTLYFLVLCVCVVVRLLVWAITVRWEE